jgi:DNA-binding CsgD family transcriptional regulator
LSPAERRVLVYLCAGYSTQPSPEALAGKQGDLLAMPEVRQAFGAAGGGQVAAELGRAEPTVKHQVSACLRKFGVPSRARLIAALR